MRKLLIAISMLFSLTVSAQKYDFSQYYSASLFLNPAFAAIYSEPNLSVNYRIQSFDVNLKDEIGQASFIFPITVKGSENRQIGGVGITGYTQEQGIPGTEQISGGMLTYAQNFKLALVSPDILAFGLQVGYETFRTDLSSLRFGSQYSSFVESGYDRTSLSPVTDYNNQSSSMILNAGLMYYYNRERNYLLYNYSAFSGISVTNLNRPDKGIVKTGDYIEPLRIRYHGAFEFNIKKMYIIPTALVQYYTAAWQFNVGGYVTYMTNASRGFSLDQRGLELVFGTWYRVNDSFVFILGVNHDTFSVNLSYDLNSKVYFPRPVDLKGWVQPAFEISLSYSRNRDSRLRKVSNPLF